MINQLLLKVDKLSFKSILLLLGISFSVSFLFLLTAIVQNGQKIIPGLAFNRQTFPTKVSFTPGVVPTIDGVKPYLGKIGDEVVLWGHDLGTAPATGYLKISDNPAQITSWTDNEIRFIIPDTQSGTITLSNGNSKVLFDRPLTIYSSSTPVTLSYDKNNGNISVDNAPEGSKLLIWSAPEDSVITNIPKGATSQTKIKTPPTVNWISILDKNDNPVSFIQDPRELQNISW